MRDNPVFQEGLQVFFTEGHGLGVCLYLLLILAPVEFFSLYLPSLDVQAWSGSASLFKVCSVTALLVMVYFAMRVANQEFAPWRFKPVKHWLREKGMSVSAVGTAQLAFLSVHLCFSLLVCMPFLVWAGAIARAPLGKVVMILLLLLFYALSYSIWGLVALVLWERRAESRQVFIRCFFFCVVVLSALFYLPLNPVAFLLATIGRQELAPLSIAGWKAPASAVHFTFHLLIGSTGLAAHRWALAKESKV